MSYLELKYNTSVLKPHQALEALKPFGFEHGRDIGAILYTDKLKSLHVEHVGELIASFGKPSMFTMLDAKYPDGLSLSEMSFELGITDRECRALIGMGILEDVSVEMVVRFLEKFDYYFGRLTMRKHIKMMYWEYKLSRDEIGNILGISYSSVSKIISKFNLGKKINGVSPKGKIGYVMPKEEREKRRKKQPHCRRVVAVDPRSFEVVERFDSIASTKVRGFCRETVRKSCRNIRLNRYRKYPNNRSRIFGVHRGVKFFYEDEFEVQKVELLRLIRDEIERLGLDRVEVEREFGVDFDLVCGEVV